MLGSGCCGDANNTRSERAQGLRVVRVVYAHGLAYPACSLHACGAQGVCCGSEKDRWYCSLKLLPLLVCLHLFSLSISTISLPLF